MDNHSLSTKREEQEREIEEDSALCVAEGLRQMSSTNQIFHLSSHPFQACQLITGTQKNKKLHFIWQTIQIDEDKLCYFKPCFELKPNARTAATHFLTLVEQHSKNSAVSSMFSPLKHKPKAGKRDLSFNEKNCYMA